MSWKLLGMVLIGFNMPVSSFVLHLLHLKVEAFYCGMIIDQSVLIGWCLVDNIQSPCLCIAVGIESNVAYKVEAPRARHSLKATGLHNTEAFRAGHSLISTVTGA